MPYLEPRPAERLLFDEYQLQEELRVAGISNYEGLAKELFCYVSGTFSQWERTANWDKQRLQALIRVLTDIHSRIVD